MPKDATYIDNVTSMALLFGVSTPTMKRMLDKPTGDFAYLDARGGALVSSLHAHGAQHQITRAASRRQAGLQHGRGNLIRWTLVDTE